MSAQISTRAPLVGFVLADPIERNFWLASKLHADLAQGPIVSPVRSSLRRKLFQRLRRGKRRRERGDAHQTRIGASRPPRSRLLLALSAALIRPELFFV
jgi:hypothetical protein